jgi:hypothetical protein
MATPYHMPMDQVEEPLYLRDFSDKQVLQLLDTALILPISSHTEHVERLIRVITKIGTRVSTVEKRDGLMRAIKVSTYRQLYKMAIQKYKQMASPRALRPLDGA